MKSQRLFLISLAWMWCLLACERTDEPLFPSPPPKGVLHWAHQFDGMALEPAQRIYANTVGNTLSITRLEYVVSQLELEDASGECLLLPGPWYINAFDDRPDTIQLPDFKPVKVRFLVGLDSNNNVSHRFDGLAGLIDLAWPDLMGGGYHFLKLEGRYLHDGTQEAGYVFHLGKTEHRVLIDTSTLTALGDSQWRLRMDVNRWFGPPVVWDLNQHANRTMHIDSAMAVLCENGRGVFNGD